MSGEASKQIEKEVLWGGGRSPFSISYGKQMMWFFLISDALTFGALLTTLGFFKLKYIDVWPNSENVFYHFPGTHAHLPLLYVALMTFILIISSVTMVLAVEAGHRNDKSAVIKWLFATVIGGAIFLGSQAWEWDTFIKGNEEHSTAFNLIDLYRADLKMGEHDGHTMQFNPEKGDAVNAAIEAIKHGHAELFIKGSETALANEDAIKRLEGAVQVQGANMAQNEYGHQLYANLFFGITGFHGFHVLSGVVINLIILLNVMNGVYDKRGHFEMVEKVGLYWHFIDLVWVFVFTFFYLI